MPDLIHIDSHGASIPNEVCGYPAASRRAAVVLVHGSDGMVDPWADLIREFAADLAGKGFAAFIPSYFDKTRTAAGFAVFSQIPDHLDAWIEAVGDVVSWVKQQPGISTELVGLLGFSLGGHICLRLRGTTQALVEFFAPELRQLGGLGARQAATPRVQIHHGSADVLVPFSETEAIAKALRSEGGDPEVFSYEGAGHGFAEPDANNAAARRASKYRTLAFFERNLQSKTEAQGAP
jgi:carboxymethylenebutenolidase